MIKKMFTLLIAVLFVVPFIAAADDFDDDFGGDEEEESESEEEEEEEAPAKVKEESESDAAMRDLMGEPEVKPAPKKQVNSENTAAVAESEESVEKTSALPKGLKPVMLVKGSFTVMGSYKKEKLLVAEDETKTLIKNNMNAMFGSVDEGILGLEYAGEHVIAKGTMNLRTDNALINEAVNNPLIRENLHSIQNGAANVIYEMYGGIKFFDVFIKAGKMLPEYGLVDTWQNLGMGFATPFLTRSLVVVEGFIPETDAGIALGYNGVIKDDHNLFVGLSLGTGSTKSEFWHSDKTIGLYGRVGYAFKDFIKAAVGFQYRTDHYKYGTEEDEKTITKDRNNKEGKNLNLVGIGIHLKGGYAGFEIPVSFDYNMMEMVKGTAKKNTTGMLISLAPGYGYDLSKHVDWLDKVAVAVRFDFVQGVYLSKELRDTGKKYKQDDKNDRDDNYLNFNNYKKNSSYMRIGATANLFTKEIAGVRGMAGLTFLMQPKSTVDKDDDNEDLKTKDYGFMTFVIQAGAEY